MASWEDRRDYFTANRPLFDDLSGAFEAALGQETDRALLHKTEGTPFVIIEGECTPEKIAELDPSAQNPHEEAEEENSLLYNGANSYLNSICRYLYNLGLDGRYSSRDLDSQPIPQLYKNAVYRGRRISNDNNERVDSVSVVELFQAGPENRIETFASYYLSLTLNGIQDHLLIVAANGKVGDAHHGVEAAETPLYDQCWEMFGPKSKAKDLYWGKFETEEELDSALATIASSTKGYPDDEVRTLLNDLREYAIRLKQAEQWTAGLELDMPTREKILELTARLRSAE